MRWDEEMIDEGGQRRRIAAPEGSTHKFMPGRKKNLPCPVDGSTRANAVNCGVRTGHCLYAPSTSSVPPSMDQSPSRPSASTKRAATRAGKSAVSHAIVSPSEVASL